MADISNIQDRTDNRFLSNNRQVGGNIILILISFLSLTLYNINYFFACIVSIRFLLLVDTHEVYTSTMLFIFIFFLIIIIIFFLINIINLFMFLNKKY